MGVEAHGFLGLRESAYHNPPEDPRVHVPKSRV